MAHISKQVSSRLLEWALLAPWELVVKTRFNVIVSLFLSEGRKRNRQPVVYTLWKGTQSKVVRIEVCHKVATIMN